MSRPATFRRAVPRLRGLGLIDNSSPMMSGSQYVFYFNTGSFGINLQPQDVVSILTGSVEGRSDITGDNNFGNPVSYMTGAGQLVVSFVYQGRGSNVINAGAEMQNVLNSGSGPWIASMTFAGAEGGGDASSPISAPGAAPVPIASGQQPSSWSFPWGTALIVTGVVLVGKMVFG